MDYHKLKTIPRSQRLRKILKMLTAAEAQFCKTGQWIYTNGELNELFSLVEGDFSDLSMVTQARETLMRSEGDIRGVVNAMRHRLLAETGRTPADWDFLDAENKLDREKRTVFKGVWVYLEDVRSPFNIGSVFRIAESFGVEKIFLSRFAADPRHKRAERTAMGCVDAVKWERGEPPWEQTSVFALETGGVPLEEFAFPQNGVMIIGSEELGVSPQSLARANTSLGRASIPLFGAKASLNASTAFAIAMYTWAKSLADNSDNV
ncbi:MAG: TrmH family RNA methyltransferase [Treponema sp.]|jgi:TrmH family RNA methyltransferase|nr:TrmH family RNA methyltransferase [Treponema sp.]